MKKAILLVNLGTPDSPQKASVRKYLSEFLNDPFVIDLPWLPRKLLVNLVIVPFRAGKSSKLYQKLWTPEGSPISIYLKKLQEKMQKEAPSDLQIFTAMRYRNPSLRQTLKAIEKEGIDELTVLPLFPQYASSTGGSIIHAVRKHLRHTNIGTVRYIDRFYNHPDYLRSFSERIAAYQPENYDHIIFSYHSLPVRHLERTHPGYDCEACTCTLGKMPEHGKNCYKAQCYETSRRLAVSLNIPGDRYTVAFQSRFAKKWVGPFTEDIIKSLARSGKKKILVAAPSFVADCLETTVEIGQDYAALFKAHGGNELVMAESLNDNDIWVESLFHIIRDSI